MKTVLSYHAINIRPGEDVDKEETKTGHRKF